MARQSAQRTRQDLLAVYLNDHLDSRTEQADPAGRFLLAAAAAGILTC